jgi:peroxiredoxin Q/BCP
MVQSSKSEFIHDRNFMLKEGDKAPGFTAKDQDGNPVSLPDFRGKRVVLFFYPKDDTPG